MKRIAALLLLLAAILAILPIGGQMMAVDLDGPRINVVSVVLNDKEGAEWGHIVSDVEPYLRDGVTFVPLRAIAERFGYSVDYQSEYARIAIADADGNELVLFTNSSQVIKNGETGAMDSPPEISNGRTFVPLRYVSEFFGLYVLWRSHPTNTVHVIWLSQVEFLTEDDVDDNLGYVEIDMPYASPDTKFFELADGSSTARGIKIGDDVEKLKEAYGPTHKVDVRSNSKRTIYYFSEGGPEGGLYCIQFIVEDNIVVRVIMSKSGYPW
jgi:hypothetical protein